MKKTNWKAIPHLNLEGKYSPGTNISQSIKEKQACKIYRPKNKHKSYKNNQLNWTSWGAIQDCFLQETHDHGG